VELGLRPTFFYSDVPNSMMAVCLDTRKRPLSEWDRILPERVYSPEEPDETLVDFVGHLCNGGKKVALDLACGAGRHTVYMTQEGFSVIGADISEAGLKMAGRRLSERRLDAALVRSVMCSLPFIDSCFDAVVCTRAIYHQRLEAIRQTISEIGRVLRKDGPVLIDFLSRRNHSYGKGVMVEKETFIETEGCEKGVVHHFTDRKELRTLFKDFRIVSMDLRESESEGRLRSRWTVQAIR
jgi:SAM-dependent methyltransferase